MCFISRCLGAKIPLDAASDTSPSRGKSIGCSICCKQIRGNDANRPHGNGRAHQSCIKALTRSTLPPHIPIPRTKRPYGTLQPTQQWKRRKQAHEAVTQVLNNIGVSLEAIHPSTIPSPADVIHLSTSTIAIYEGSDGWEQLNHLTHELEPPFKGDSVSFPHIFAVLQHLIDTRNAFLNGDWCFINSILGLMSPSATHPCPICIVGKNNLINTSRYRTPSDKHSIDRTHTPLLTINPDHIVPTPLHLFLGISNRIILDALKEILGESVVLEAVKSIKTVHTAGCTGLSDLYDLNGPEISKFIKKECSTDIITSAVASSSTSTSTKASYSVLSRWLKQLHHSLLHSNNWTTTDIDAWRSAVNDIHQHWQQETHSSAFPKLHMLHHTIDFAERYRFLGKVSEAQIESFHATFNELFHKHHHNMSNNTGERLRRCLADATLHSVQPLINQ